MKIGPPVRHGALRRALALALLMLAACSKPNNGLETLCGFYQELAAEPAVHQMSERELYTSIRLRLTAELGEQTLARAAWEAAASAQRGQRYFFFKRAVDSELPKPFECAAMKRLFDQDTGVPSR
jgi:hypothetical protein